MFQRITPKATNKNFFDMSAPSPHTPPRPGQKFRFKPDTVVEFKCVMYSHFITNKPFVWIFNHAVSGELLYYPEEIIGFLHDKHLRPI